jgi:hypothetical protein
MRPEQRIVVKWMRCQLDRLEWVPERWANEAGLAPTTVTRAMSKNYDSVSSVTTLNALARAAGIPSIVDFLAGQAALEVSDYPVLTKTLEEILPVLGCELPPEKLTILAEAIGSTISGLSRRNG